MYTRLNNASVYSVRIFFSLQGNDFVENNTNIRSSPGELILECMNFLLFRKDGLAHYTFGTVLVIPFHLAVSSGNLLISVLDK